MCLLKTATNFNAACYLHISASPLFILAMVLDFAHSRINSSGDCICVKHGHIPSAFGRNVLLSTGIVSSRSFSLFPYLHEKKLYSLKCVKNLKLQKKACLFFPARNTQVIFKNTVK